MILQTALLGMVGACGASFAANVGLRSAAGRNWIGGRSGCTACLRRLSYAETVPLLSYAGIRGRCAGCRAPVSIGYLLAEAAGFALLPLSIALYGPGSGFLVFCLILTLGAASVCDQRSGRIPDTLTALAALLSLAISGQGGGIGIAVPILSALLVGAAGLTVRAVTRPVDGHPGLGLGDVKLAAAAALWLGPLIAPAVVLASFAALISPAPRPRIVQFGPFLAAGIVLIGLARAAVQSSAF